MTRNIEILVFPDFQLLDAAGPVTAFEAASRERMPPAYRLRIVARNEGPLASSSGVQVLAKGFANNPVDTLIVAGGWGTTLSSASAETLWYIRAASNRARRVASVCSGAFILAAAGLLDGRRVTTHWARAAELARAYPQIRVEPDRIFIRDGKLWSSAGITAGIDLALAMIADDLGEVSLSARHNKWWFTTAGPVVSRNSRRCSTSIVPAAVFRPCSHGRESGFKNAFRSGGSPTRQA
jgi:transcriptional regulator GlxA family with amidase domain